MQRKLFTWHILKTFAECIFVTHLQFFPQNCNFFPLFQRPNINFSNIIFWGYFIGLTTQKKRILQKKLETFFITHFLHQLLTIQFPMQFSIVAKICFQSNWIPNKSILYSTIVFLTAPHPLPRRLMSGEQQKNVFFLIKFIFWKSWTFCWTFVRQSMWLTDKGF